MADSFSPLFSGRNLSGSKLQSMRVHVMPTEEAAILSPKADAPAHAGCAAEAAVKVTLQKQGDIVTGVRIDCACGQVINLSCVY